MNTSQLKSYAPEARRNFITAVSAQATRLGITATSTQTAQVQGDVLLIGGNAFSKSIDPARKRLVDRIRAHGYNATMEAIAYTWFNRFAAIRYMELHGYLDHGYRVLSHPEGHGRPEILDHAADVDLPGLDRSKVVELKLDGAKDEELYRLLLMAQCDALHKAMPFLFERLGDETELLLPTNLLHTDSLIRQLVERIDESAWQEIEIIGWLYQFYISEKHDQVIGKVVASEDIPAATQLFTPNWIVKYMVQNSLGAQWLATYPNSPLKGQMEYYIEPAEQTDEVNAQLAAITPSTLNPEELTLIDPASGSGHILVEAYELFKAIYLERGYRQRDVPQLILEKNLFGLDIDERAAQLTGFGLMMKGRADDRRLFERGVKLNVMALVDSAGLEADEIIRGLGTEGRIELVSSNDMFPDTLLQPPLAVTLKRDVDVEAIRSLIALFEHATTFGSLIQVPEELAEKLPALKKLSEATSVDMFVAEALKRLGPLVRQAELLAAQYDAVVANPPYMGSAYYCGLLKKYVNAAYKAGKADLYGAFTLRNIQLAKVNGHIGMITIPNWLFITSFEDLRHAIFQTAPISNLVHNGRGVWGSDFGSCSYVLRRSSPNGFSGRFVRLFDKQGSVASNEELEHRFYNYPRFSASNTEFEMIPGCPVAYWVSESVRRCYEPGDLVLDDLKTAIGLNSGDNNRFLRCWHEVGKKLYLSCDSIESAAASGGKWFPYAKGGSFRKWYGNRDFVFNWENDGAEVKEFAVERNNGKHWSRYIQNLDWMFRPGLTWTFISSSNFGMRFHDGGSLFDVNGSCAFPRRREVRVEVFLGLLCSPVAFEFLRAQNPTMAFQARNIGNIPWIQPSKPNDIAGNVSKLIGVSRIDWDAYERSWDFQSLPILTASSEPTPTLESSYNAWIAQNRDTIAQMKSLEEENNRLFIDAYGLQDELTPDVPIEQITLTVNPAYRYGGNLSEEQLWIRFREDSMQELVSYAIGCMMGRYSLDEPGLIYAHSGNVGFNPSRYPTFPADDDGLLPLTDTDWFDDDAAHRLVDFISVAWDAAHLEANLTFLADNLAPKNNESSRETVRRYLCDSFFKDHLQTYKKRPIYWLFSSGKQKAFQCLVYLHRYNEGTLSRMRSEYVIPLQGKMAARLDQLQGDIEAATSTAQSKRLEKERAKLQKQQVELLAFDEKLRHYADMRITLDLDDGVKVNYGKFGDLLAEVKAVTGGKGENA